MSLPVVLLAEAAQDVAEGRDFYDRALPGLGLKYSAAVLKVLDRIGLFPELYGEVQPGVRAAGVRRFGYVIYYRTTPAVVEVLAVLRGGRDPGILQSRV